MLNEGGHREVLVGVRNSDSLGGSPGIADQGHQQVLKLFDLPQLGVVMNGHAKVVPESLLLV